jgi:signal transduction histidine kinase
LLQHAGIAFRLTCDTQRNDPKVRLREGNMRAERRAAERSSVFVSTVAAGRGERRFALAVVLVSLLCFLAAVPFVRVPLLVMPAFIPAYEAALEISDLITAIMLLGQFTRLRSPALLTLACGYLFDALMIVPHALSFPGVFTATGLLGAGPQTTAWLYIFWHGGFPLFVLGYAALRSRKPEPLAKIRPARAIALSAAAVATLSAALTLAATAGHDLLPIVMRGSDYSLLVAKGVSPAVWLLSLAALLALWRLRPASVLDIWLMVVMCAWLLDVALAAVIGSQRYDLGFYAGRSYGLLAAGFVLAVLLLEGNRLYGRLADALEIAEAYNAELERSREGLARAQRMEAIGQLTGGIAHDFNNLLTVVIGNIDIAIGLVGTRDALLAGHLAAAMRGAQRGARITAQLLATGRRQRLDPEALDIEATVAAMTELLRSALSTGVALRFAIPPRLPKAIADAAQLEVALLNLIVNSRDALGGSGTVTVSAHEVTISPQEAIRLELAAGAYVVLAVADSGPGMTPDVAARAFEPFFTTKGMATSSGLGLSQVYGFARQSGGTCVIDSAPGRGATVSIYLPAMSRPAADGSAAATAMPLPAAVPREFGARIMVVEDDDDVREYLADFLGKVGFDVTAAGDGVQALKLIEHSERIDVLCTDIVMPGGLNGYELARSARSLQPDLKVIFMSGYSEKAAAPANGNAPFLAKPFLGPELVETVRTVIGR